MILSWFSRQTFWWIIKMDCCLWALSGPEGGEGTISKMCVQFIYPDFCGKHLGEFSSLIVVFGPCQALRWENTISKRCVQFTILDSILIFLPNIWVSYQVGLLSLGPVGPWEGRTQFLKCVYNSTFLILSWYFCQTFGGVIKFDLLSLGQTHNC